MYSDRRHNPDKKLLDDRMLDLPATKIRLVDVRFSRPFGSLGLLLRTPLSVIRVQLPGSSTVCWETTPSCWAISPRSLKKFVRLVDFHLDERYNNNGQSASTSQSQVFHPQAYLAFQKSQAAPEEDARSALNKRHLCYRHISGDVHMEADSLSNLYSHPRAKSLTRCMGPI